MQYWPNSLPVGLIAVIVSSHMLGTIMEPQKSPMTTYLKIRVSRGLKDLRPNIIKIKKSEVIYLQYSQIRCQSG